MVSLKYVFKQQSEDTRVLKGATHFVDLDHKSNIFGRQLFV